MTTATLTTCKHCGLSILPIIDPWGFDNWQGVKYGFYHVEAQENAEGRYATSCADGDNDAEPNQ